MTAPSMAELNMIMVTLQTMVPEFPKLEIGELGTIPRRLQQWLLSVTQALEPTGHHVMSWWRWVRTSAETTHSIFLTKSLDQRERVLPTDSIPAHLAQVESWMRSRILACLLKIIREWVDLRATAGVVEPSHVLLYYLFKSFARGSPNEKDGLLRKVLNPNVCTQPQAAQLELMRWRSDVLRLRALGCMPPDLTLSYRALESIFGVVFDQAEP